VADRTLRASAVDAAAAELRAQGLRPYVIPIGASTPLGAAAFVRAVGELLTQVDPPDVIVHSSSSGGTQAGLAAGCRLAGLRTRVIGISADETSPDLTGEVRSIISGLPSLLTLDPSLLASTPIDVDDRFVGGGYGVPTNESREAIELLARTEAIFLDPTYTAKAAAGLISRWRAGEFPDGTTVLFWHTGGQVGLFA
jgi:1-aminocyclopropane-1-carboxylate deaminase/D-cysteine desulfhydrase-like pyridoxal-dependent ACC family enzyme